MSGLSFASGIALMLAMTAAAADPALFPNGRDLKVDGATLTLRPPGADAILLTPVRYVPAPGRTMLANAYRCGIELRAEGRVPAGVETLGIGNTETMSCDGLAAAGLVRSPRGLIRIALVYRTRSPNAASRTPVIVQRRGPAEAWTVDDELSLRLAERLGTVTIPAIRRALQRR